MTRIAGFRATISADRSTTSRLSYGSMSACINSKSHAIGVTAMRDQWTISLMLVTGIGTGGASFDKYRSLDLSSDDMEALVNGTKKLALVEA